MQQLKNNLLKDKHTFTGAGRYVRVWGWGGMEGGNAWAASVTLWHELDQKNIEMSADSSSLCVCVPVGGLGYGRFVCFPRAGDAALLLSPTGQAIGRQAYKQERLSLLVRRDISKCHVYGDSSPTRLIKSRTTPKPPRCHPSLTISSSLHSTSPPTSKAAPRRIW